MRTTLQHGRRLVAGGPRAMRVRPWRRCFGSRSIPELRVYVSHTTDPCFNLATEDWLFRGGVPGGNGSACNLSTQEVEASSPTQTLFLWRNEPTVVIGRNQNPWAECHVQRMEDDGVHLVRRHSGGGAVYQDLGNTNFTLISTPSRAVYDKSRNMGIVASALNSFTDLQGGAIASGRNDIEVGGRKVSGSAFKMSRGRAFHHGTLMVNVDMEALPRYLSPNKEKLASKGVKSVQARVMNLQQAIPSLNHEDLCDALVASFARTYGTPLGTVRDGIVVLRRDELEQEPSLAEAYEALRDWDWRFGETPQFEHHLSKRFDWGTFDVHVDSKGGTITSAKVFSDCLMADLPPALAKALEGKPYDAAGIRAAVAEAQAFDASAPWKDLESWLVGAI